MSVKFTKNIYILVVTGKFTNERLGPLNIGGSCELGCEACLALIHRDRVMLASFSSLRRLLISAFRTCVIVIASYQAVENSVAYLYNFKVN